MNARDRHPAEIVLPSDPATLPPHPPGGPVIQRMASPTRQTFPTEEGIDMRKLLFATLAASLAVLPGLRADAQTVVNADVTTDTNWSGVIVIERPIFVKSGATLTIDPGTIVRGQPRTAAVLAGSTVGTPGALVVTQNGQIVANGTANNPIIMTTAAVDNNGPLGAGPPDNVADDDDGNGFRDAWTPGDLFLDDTPATAPLAPLNATGGQNVALWGGLVVLGNASTNLSDPCGTGQGTCTVEGLTVPGFPAADCRYGGTDDADSSGSLSYISVRHAGDEIGNSNELNGDTMAGGGNGTDFHHIEVYANFDDGIEWFGGTVNGDHLNVVFAGDDSFDADQGYRGTNQFLATILTYFNQDNQTTPGVPPFPTYGSLSGDKGCEWDGDDWDEPTVGTRVNTDVNGQPDPFSNATWWNFTIAGSAQSTTYNGHTNDNDGCEMRHGFAGTANNGIIYDTLGRQGIDDAGLGTDVPPAGAANGDFRTPANALAGLIHVHDVTCNSVTGYPVAAPDTAEENEILSGTGANENEGFGSANIGCNGVNDPDFALVAETTSFTPTGVSGKLDSSLATIDLRPANTTATMTGSVPPGSLDTTATYRGAFAPSPAALWVNGWTALAEANILPEPNSMSALAAGAVLLMLLKRRR